ncbi:allantoate amidohydrolase [Lichenicoccus sp.]|uniref:allantoate amidohydrolase n=1 Tax=Lichenicoccus sp. TaxID=2781899 RepID=UPI003D0F6798
MVALAGFDLMARLDRLAACSDGEGLTRLYLSDAHARAVALVRGWMEEAGLRTRLDAAATLIGRRDGPPGAPTLLVGSHLDTVRDAGRYDGALGVLAGLAALHRLAGERLPCAVELLAFGDEEGVRFPLTMTGSRACAGTLDVAAHLASRDADGITLGEALAAFGGDPDGLATAAYRPEDVLGFLEVHIEQGPVLEQAGLALGVVSAINGCRRFIVTVLGEAGHAGTVPMTARRDALAAAAAMIVAVRKAGLNATGVTATVGQIQASPGAINVIAGSAIFSLDVRAPDDATRDAAVARILASFAAIAAAHGVRHTVAAGFYAPATPCSESLQVLLEQAAASLDLATMRLPSGAGHDAMVMAQLCPMAMLFVRCAGGISHNPAERITASDAECAVNVLTRALRAIT